MSPRTKIAVLSSLILLCSNTATAKSFVTGVGNVNNAGISTTGTGTTGTGTTGTGTTGTVNNILIPVANNDSATVVPNTKTNVITGNVTDNDVNGITATLNGSPVGTYGYIIFKSDGSYTYTVDQNSPKVIALAARQVVSDQFNYTYSNSNGQRSNAQLTIQIIGNPVDGSGNTVFQLPADKPFDNVDIEFNNRSAQATPVNPGHNIKGHLYNSSDKDWYKITTKGNEIVTLTMCPQGEACFGKKSWVMYVFDSALMDKTIKRDSDNNPVFDSQGKFIYIPTSTKMEDKVYPLYRWVDATGTIKDNDGNDILAATTAPSFIANYLTPRLSQQYIGSSNHMYLAYNAGFFEGALIGIIDPCYDISSSVQVGVPEYSIDANGSNGTGNTTTQTHDYFIAVSSPLKRDNGKDCSSGSVILQKPGLGTAGTKDGQATDYTTTKEYIVAFPNSDDQYAINIDILKKNNVSIPPLMPSDQQLALFSTARRSLKIPQLRIADKLYAADLTQQISSRSTNSPLKFNINSVNTLAPETLAAAYQGTYNPENQQVMLPRVVVDGTSDAYSVILQYHPESDNSAAWLEVIQADVIRQ